MQKVVAIFKNHKKKTIGLILAALLLAGAGQVLGNRNNQALTVVTGNVIEDKFEQSVFATGTLEVKDKKEIFTKIFSVIAEILVEPGEKVEAGQVLLRLESDDLELKVAEAQALLNTKQSELISLESGLSTEKREADQAIKDYERQKALHAMGAVSLNELELAEQKMLIAQENVKLLTEAKIPLARAQVKEAQAALKRAQEALNEAEVKSPIAGTVLSLPVKEGYPVQAGTLLAGVGNLEELQIETGINEVDAFELEVGNEVEITSDGILQEGFKGIIEYIAPIAQIERTSQGEQTQVKIRVAVEAGAGFKLKPGYSVNMKVILNQKDKAVLVPYEAVTQRDGKDVVFVVDNEGKVIEREIGLGLSNALFFEVLSGVSAGEKVILNPTEKINAGVRVKVDDRNK